MNTHEKISEMLTGFALHELTDKQSNEVKQHLDQCPRCKEELKRLETVLGCAESMSQLSANNQSCESAKQSVIKKAENEEKATQTPRPYNRLEIIRRTIMKSSITKLAAAAVIITAVLLSINFWDNSIPTAYALEQTIQANHTVRYLHIQDFSSEHKDEPKEFWVECDKFGQVENARIHFPEWASPDDGAKVIVWKQNKVQVLFKRKNIFFIAQDKTTADRMLKLVEGCDPRLAVERLYKQQAQGEVKIEIEEPSDKAKPIAVTATYLPESSSPNKRVVLLVDQATKLVMAAEFYQLKDGEYQYIGAQEYYDYNQPIESKMFTLDDEVPADVMHIDQTTQDVGLAQGDLNNEEIAIEVARQFFEALIAEDYAKAGRLLEGIPADRLKQELGHIKFLRIISIGPAFPHPIPETKGLIVPCTVEVEKDGQISELKLDRLGVRQVLNQPSKWTIFGGF